MTLFERLSLLTPWDAAAVLFLFAAWGAIGWRIEHPTAGRPSVSVLMADYRRAWMTEMIGRQPRIFDAQILATLRQGTSFFASTSVIAIGGTLALAGNTAPLQMVAEGAGVAVPGLILQLKLVAVVLFLTNAFLRFVWSNRLFGYCAVVMASVPNDTGDPLAPVRAGKAAELNIRAAMNFNRGLRSVYFALGALAWLLGPAALAIATVAVVWVLWSRDFASIPHRILSETPR